MKGENRVSIFEYVRYTFNALSPENRTERLNHYIDAIKTNAEIAYRQNLYTADMVSLSYHYLNILNESKYFFFCAHYVDVEID